MIQPFQDRLDRRYLFKKTFQMLYERMAPDEWILAKTEGVSLYVNVHDRYLSRFIIQEGTYEKGTTKVFENVVEEGMTVFDIGAHIGYYSLIAARLVGIRGKVYAFEPHPSNYELLTGNISVNGFSNISPLKKAVTDKNGTIKMFWSRRNPVLHSLLLRENEDDFLTVETIALDNLLEETGILPDVVKMDIEGAEILALKGMEKTIQTSRNLVMFIEYEHNKEELLNFLSRYFDIYRVTKDGELISFDEAEERKNKDFERNLYCVSKK